jgi:hypothetical protein
MKMLFDIKFKDIFKPRYALVGERIRIPNFHKEEWDYAVAVLRVPYKRPLNMSFNTFYNTLTKENSNGLVICGSYWTLRAFMVLARRRGITC